MRPIRGKICTLMDDLSSKQAALESNSLLIKEMKQRAVVLAMNPSIDLEWEVPQVVWEEKNIIESERRWAGGKGINVSRWLHHLGSPYHLLAPLGGEIGRELHQLLTAEGLHFGSIPIKHANRVDVIVTTQEGRQMRFNPRGPLISEEEMENLFTQIEKELVQAACLILSGSLPRGASPDTYGHLIERAARCKVPCLLDCDGQALRKAIASQPFLVKPNDHELARWAGRKELATDDQVVEAGRAMSQQTGHWVFVSRGARRSWLIDHSKGVAFYADPPLIKPVNTVGAGDALLAAVAAEILRGAAPEDWLRKGVGIGTAATELPAGKLPEAQAIDQMVSRVKIGT